MTDPTFHVDWDEEHGRGDEAQRFALYRLCPCPACDGTGKDVIDLDDGYGESRAGRCALCRGEGRTRELAATTGTAEGVGVALVTLAREGEWYDADGNPCAFGLLDRGADVATGKRWLVRPWLASPRNVSDAGRVLASAPRKRGGATA